MSNIPPRRHQSSDSFDPRYKDVFKQGRVGAYVLEFPSHNDAIAFRMRAQQYRKALQRENKEPELVKLYYQVTLRIEGRKLFVEPADTKFADVFDKLGQLPSPGGPRADATSQVDGDERRGDPDSTQSASEHEDHPLDLTDIFNVIDHFGEPE